MADTIFSKILSGEIPCHKVYEDSQVLAFLDIFPLSKGHTLVIPKEPAATLDQLSAESAAAVGRVLPAIARAVMAEAGTSEYNILQNNGVGAHQAVFHVHFHIIPKHPRTSPTESASLGTGLGVGWEPSSTFDHSEGAALASRIAQRLA